MQVNIIQYRERKLGFYQDFNVFMKELQRQNQLYLNHMADPSPQTVQKSQTAGRYRSNINSYCVHVYQLFEHIRYEFEKGFISQEVFTKYLLEYKTAINSGSGLDCYLRTPYHDIKKYIDLYLPG